MQQRFNPIIHFIYNFYFLEVNALSNGLQKIRAVEDFGDKRKVVEHGKNFQVQVMQVNQEYLGDN